MFSASHLSCQGVGSVGTNPAIHWCSHPTSSTDQS